MGNNVILNYGAQWGRGAGSRLAWSKSIGNSVLLPCDNAEYLCRPLLRDPREARLPLRQRYYAAPYAPADSHCLWLSDRPAAALKHEKLKHDSETKTQGIRTPF